MPGQSTARFLHGSGGDVDLRYAGVTVRLFTQDVLGLTEQDAELARQISTAARELDALADPSRVQDVDLTIDAQARAGPHAVLAGRPEVRAGRSGRPVAAALAAGGRLVSDAHAPAWWTLADTEGNEVVVATWMGRD